MSWPSPPTEAVHSSQDSLSTPDHPQHTPPRVTHSHHMHTSHMVPYSSPAYSRSIPTVQPMSNPFQALLNQIRQGPPRRRNPMPVPPTREGSCDAEHSDPGFSSSHGSPSSPVSAPSRALDTQIQHELLSSVRALTVEVQSLHWQNGGYTLF
jgi:hypothetical protein